MNIMHDVYAEVFSGFFSSGDWATILLFLGMGLVYFLAPVVGYTLANRVGIALALWVLVGKMCLTLIRLSLLTTQLIDKPNSSPDDWFTSTFGLVLLYIPILETSALILAMVMFIFGLQRLKRQT
ncbi:MAG TPA: hypothetical protein VGY77_01510 [Gemmataceae bacterium]|jgi:hypothetical protein|nr:hypothetical protein [Gemmataceae bacterium]